MSSYDQAPTMFRTMKVDGDRPLVGSGKAELGVRVPPDVTPDETGVVHPGEGMSVSPSLRQLPYFLIPRRLGQALGLDGVKAPNHWHVWRMGSGTFATGAVGPGLALRRDSVNHGVVEPSYEMPLSVFQMRLGSTRDVWVIDET